MNNDAIYSRVQKNIDNLVSHKVSWSVPVTHDEIVHFLDGDWASLNMFLPRREWIIDTIRDANILCLAAAGGQQAPLFAAAGAHVVVFDISAGMLSQDKMVAARENLSIQIEQGNMCDLSRFSDEAFDLIINPASLMYVPDILPVFRECYRVLNKGGVFIMNAPNPINFICEYDEISKNYVACNSLPYRSFEHSDQGDWIEFGHTLESYLGGLIDAGFIISGFYEDRRGEPCDTSFITKATKI